MAWVEGSGTLARSEAFPGDAAPGQALPLRPETLEKLDKAWADKKQPQPSAGADMPPEDDPAPAAMAEAPAVAPATAAQPPHPILQR